MRQRALEVLTVIGFAGLVAWWLFSLDSPVGFAHTKTGFRIATYNVAFLSARDSEERFANLRSVIRNLNPDVLAFQEIEGRAALAKLLGPGWQIGIEDHPSESQELAIAVRSPLKLVSFETVFPDKSLDYAFPDRRDVLRAKVLIDGEPMVFYVVHAKSRSGGRIETDFRRVQASIRMVLELRRRADRNVLVLGDFNDSPDDQSVNILETGSPFAIGEAENDHDDFLFNTTEAAWEDDVCSFGLYQLYRGRKINPSVAGARKENNRLRGKVYRFPADVAVTQILFDQIFVSPHLASRVTNPARVYAEADALRGTKSQVVRTESGTATARHRGSLASDHVPVYIDLLPSGR